MKKESVLTKLHPVVTLIYLAGALGITMMTMHPLMLGTSLMLSGWYIVCLRGWRDLRYSFGVAIPVLLFSVGILPLFSHNGITPLFYINGMAVTAETVVYGLAMTVLLVSIFQWFQIWNALLDSERFFYLFGRVLPSAGLLLSMTFRLIPLMRQRFREIHDAQKGIGIDIVGMPFVRRCRFFVKECSILISWSLENSMDTAISMESRGYGTGKRSSFHLFIWEKRDIIWGSILLILFGSSFWIVAKGAFRTSYFPEMVWQTGGISQAAGLAGFLAGAMIPVIWDMAEWGNMMWHRTMRKKRETENQNRKEGKL